MDQLLIVTCYRDAQQFLIQCQSIGENLESCCVNIVINEHYADPWVQWFDTNVAKYLTNHSVQIYKWTDFVSNYTELSANDYNKQQLYKLLFATKTDCPYVVLDSKDWVVRPVSLNTFHSSQRAQNIAYLFRTFYQYCQDRWGRCNVRGHITPYRMDNTVVCKLLDQFASVAELSALFDQYTTDHSFPSEFIMYDVFAQSCGHEQDPGSAVNYSARLPSDSVQSGLAVNYWQSFCNNPQYTVLTIPPADFKQIQPRDLYQFLLFLNTKYS